MRKAAMALLLAIWQVGCGGEDFYAPALPALPRLQQFSSTQCTPNGATIRIQLFGDSTQAGAVRGGTAAVTPTGALQTDLDDLFGLGVVTVEDRAAPSSYTAQLLLGTDGVNAPWPLSVAADIVVINHGINDASRRVLPRIYQDQLAQLVMASPARVVLETPNPTIGTDVRPYVSVMRAEAQARGLPVADTWAVVSSLPHSGLGYLSDWAHPRQDLYLYIVRNSLVPALVPLVQRVVCR